jgi:hypothetical protein
MAVEDAYSLTDAVEKVGLNGKAFELYEEQCREKVDWTVSTSWNIGRMCHLKNPVLRGVRNVVLRKMLSGGGEKQIKKLYSIDEPSPTPTIDSQYTLVYSRHSSSKPMIESGNSVTTRSSPELSPAE